MKGKMIKFDDECRQAIKRGIDKVANAVGKSMGPISSVIAIKEEWGSTKITKDGVSIARSIKLSDPFEDIGAEMIRMAAIRCVEVSGDGTSACCVLGQSIFNRGLYLLAAGYRPMALKRGIDKAVEMVVENLNKIAKSTQDKNDITKVATISANDAEIGQIVSDAILRVGLEGIVTVDENATNETTLQMTEGMEFDRGYLTPWFITNIDRNCVEMANCFILIHEERMEDVKIILPLLEEVSKQGRPIVIIAEDFGQNFISTLIQNKRSGALFSCPIKAPGFGERRKEILKDLAVLTGATPFCRDLGNNVGKCEIEDLGTAEKISVTRSNTIILNGGGTKEEVLNRVSQIRDDIKNLESYNEYDRKRMQERLAKLIGGIAVIKVGAHTEIEMKERKDRVEDALCATKAAIQEGVVPGGGVALLRCIPVLKDFAETLTDRGEKAGVEIIISALETPARIIVKNAGVKPDLIIDTILKNDNPNFGYNAASGQYEDLVLSGVIDPKKVIRSAIQNAASVASLLLTTEVCIADEPEEKDEDK